MTALVAKKKKPKAAEYKVQQQMEQEFQNSYFSMLVNMNKTLIAGFTKLINQKVK